MSTRAKEATKTALAFTLAYGLALKTGWLSATWVGLTVVVIALPSAGQSLQKGILRLAGTVPGCIAALTILALAGQSRWFALALTCTWMFVTTYMMLSRPRRAYTWNVAGFTALIIMTGAFESPADVFDRASTRTVATVVGIAIYTLVTTFLWPRSNSGAIRKALQQLLATQRERFNALRAHPSDPVDEPLLRSLQLREVQQLATLDEALQAEGSESYEVREIRPELERLRLLCGEILDCLDRLETSVPTKGALRASLPGVDDLLDEVDARFASMLASFDSDATSRTPVEVSLSPDREALALLSPLDRAAVVVARAQLASLASLTKQTVASIQGIVTRQGARVPAPVRHAPRPSRKTSAGWDLDHLRGAMLVASTVVVGFGLWVFLNPPGHASWVMLPPILAMMVAGRQQLSAKVFIRPTAIALALGIAIYVFVLPKLSTFAELGLVLFAAMFVVNYFTSGIGQLAGMIGVLMGISVQQQQVYSFAAMANSYIFTLGAFVLVYAMSYAIRSPRPEKAVLYLARRFFRSAGFLIANTSAQKPVARWRFAWHREELRRLPSKIEAWSKAIDYRVFPGTAPDRVQALVIRMRAVAYRIDELLDFRGSISADSLAGTLADDLRVWRSRLESTLFDWALRPESPADVPLRQQIDDWRAELERKVESLSDEEQVAGLGDDEWRRFYALLGGYRGVSATLLAYGDEARQIDWAAWREERFT